MESEQDTNRQNNKAPKFKRQALMAEGFKGYVPFKELLNGRIAEVPRSGGVYLVLREIDGMPTFLENNSAGQFKEKDPTVSADKLTSNWVDNAHVIYIGK